MKTAEKLVEWIYNQLFFISFKYYIMSVKNSILQLGNYLYNSMKILDITSITNSLIDLVQSSFNLCRLNLNHFMLNWNTNLVYNNPSISKYYTLKVGDTIESIIDLSGLAQTMDTSKITLITNLSRQTLKYTITQINNNFIHFNLSYLKTNGTMSKNIGFGTLEIDQQIITLPKYKLSYIHKSDKKQKNIKLNISCNSKYSYSEDTFKGILTTDLQSDYCDCEETIFIFPNIKTINAKSLHYTNISNIPNKVVYII